MSGQNIVLLVLAGLVLVLGAVVLLGNRRRFDPESRRYAWIVKVAIGLILAAASVPLWTLMWSGWFSGQ